MLKKIVSSFATIFVLFISFSLALAEETANPIKQDLHARKLAFERDDNIWISNGDGTGQKLLIKNGHSPAWSPDRKHIAFARNCNLWMAKADGSGQYQLTNQWQSSDPDFCEMHISWNPVRPIITFSHEEIYRIKRKGRFQEIMPQQDFRKGFITGTSIFEIRTDRKKKATVRYDIFEAATSFNFANNDNPAWSPTGLRFAFSWALAPRLKPAPRRLLPRAK